MQKFDLPEFKAQFLGFFGQEGISFAGCGVDLEARNKGVRRGVFIGTVKGLFGPFLNVLVDVLVDQLQTVSSSTSRAMGKVVRVGGRICRLRSAVS